MKYLSFFAFCLITLFTCSKDEPGQPDPTSSTAPNILLIIADDMGKDATAGFSEGNDKPNTPNINGLKSSGITFNNCWVYPTCSPTRASIITGKYGLRTGVKWANDALDNSETILHEYISEQTNGEYTTALIGKWHLSGGNGATPINPETLGMDYYAGLIGGGVQNYYQWELTEDGSRTTQANYITEKFTDLSIDWINAQEKPWFLWLAYNAPHTPFHVPPAEMHAQGELFEYTQGMNALPYYLAAIEAMDYQIGRLLERIPESVLENTVILFLGDNGTPNQVAQSPYSNTTAKGTLYQGGINTPLFVSGSGVNRVGEEDDNLITSTDLFATIAEIAGVDVTELHDSKSFKALLSSVGAHRSFQYSEMKSEEDDLWAISDGRYKLILSADGNSEMYHLEADPYESDNLLDEALDEEQLNAKAALEAELERIR